MAGLRGWAAVIGVLAGGGALAAGRLAIPVAACFVLCGVALWALRPAPSPLRRRVGDVAAGLAAVIALFAIVQGVAEVAALCILLIASGLLSLDRPRVFATGRRLAVAAGFIAFLSVVASAYPARGMGPAGYAAIVL
ncbi:MAG TPA: hypothetical protein VLK35_07730, partial [Methylomirabilota bacterium]|nr:hypothetical protein [Methylomirabilota bacterium]